ncbi:elongation factor 4 [Candidatus Uhrbacteria bacterium]|nr:elongation factor 4 [Candidatus Uhrbacteria bacterium]
MRNFCIIAHIDHGKSTLADRLIEYTHTIDRREMKAQLLDQMDLERERGITIKLQPVRMDYRSKGKTIVLNLIDTPGHVDFTYEVSRSLAAVEGAILLVDASQGVQAQTLANLYLALDQNLTIIPVMNKIDLASARPNEVRNEIVNLLGCSSHDVLAVSAKTGQGVTELLDCIVEKIPDPQSKYDDEFRGLIFDSVYDEYRGVVAYIRVFSGKLKKGEHISFMATRVHGQALEVGYFKPKYTPTELLSNGEIGYIVTGLKDVDQCRVGDTIISSRSDHIDALPGYKEVKPMVFAGLFCKDGDSYKYLREAVHKLKLNDAAFSFEPEHSPALGFGFRCGFLGLLHLEIVQERLKREYDLDLIVTIPSVAYIVTMLSAEIRTIHGPLELPESHYYTSIKEPWVRADIVTPESTIGSCIALATEKFGIYKNTEYLSGDASSPHRRVILHFELPLSAILVDFYDKLKSITSGYASMNYEFSDYRNADIVRLDVQVAGESVEALASIVYKDQSYSIGRKIVESLKKILPRKQFEIKIQASVGSKVIASERISALRKDVTAKLYGGDVSRKQKLLEKQKKGKKRMAHTGHVDIPTEAYLSILKR